MQIPLLKGRWLTDDDQIVGVQNILISVSAARALWPGQDPIGRRIQSPGSKTDYSTVVGVVGDVMQRDFRHPADPLIYFPLVGPTAGSWRISSPAYVVRTRRADAIGPEIRSL